MIGTSILGIACWALLRGADGSGLLGIVIFGGIALLLGLVGRIPNQLTISDKAYDFSLDDSNEVVESLTEQLAPEALQEVADQVSRTSPSPNASPVEQANRQRIMDIVGFERSMFDLVREVADHEGTVALTNQIARTTSGRLVEADALISIGTAQIVFDFKLSLSSKSLRMNMIRRWMDLAGLNACVVVIVRDITPQTLQEVLHQAPPNLLIFEASDLYLRARLGEKIREIKNSTTN